MPSSPFAFLLHFGLYILAESLFVNAASVLHTSGSIATSVHVSYTFSGCYQFEQYQEISYLQNNESARNSFDNQQLLTVPIHHNVGLLAMVFIVVGTVLMIKIEDFLATTCRQISTCTVYINGKLEIQRSQSVSAIIISLRCYHCLRANVTCTRRFQSFM